MSKVGEAGLDLDHPPDRLQGALEVLPLLVPVPGVRVKGVGLVEDSS